MKLIIPVFLLFVSCGKSSYNKISTKGTSTKQDTTSCNQGNLQRCFIEGVRANEQGHIAEAEELLGKACDGGYKTGCLQLRHAKGLKEYQEGNTVEAEKIFRETCDAGIMLGCSKLGTIEKEDGNHVAAADLFRQSCNGGSTSGCVSLGVVEKEQGHIIEAETSFKKACKDGNIQGCSEFEVIKKEQVNTPETEISVPVPEEPIDRNIAQSKKLYSKVCGDKDRNECKNLGAIEYKINNGRIFSFSRQHTCTLKDGTMKCWGYNDRGGLGVNIFDYYHYRVTTPKKVSLRGRAKSIDTGYDYSCAILEDGKLKCWGRNYSGQTGLGKAALNIVESPQPVDLGLGRMAKFVVLGHGEKGHTCAALDDDTLKCWGDNTYGQVGIGSNNSKITTPQTVPLGGKAKSVVVGYTYTCAILDDGALQCWGTDRVTVNISSGTVRTTRPKTINLGGEAKSVKIGDLYICAVLVDDTLKCFDGYLGNIDKKIRTISLGGKVNVLDLGESHACAILKNGTLKCWGTSASGNQLGQLGIGTKRNVTTPQTINLGAGRTAKFVKAGAFHTCAILDNDTLKCWGFNTFGQIAVNSKFDQYTPQLVDLERKVKSVAVLRFHTCAFLDDDTLKCWGHNAYGELGIGNTNNQYIPQEVEL